MGQPFVSRPPYDTLLDLSPVFGWVEGSATAINDHGDIVGSGSGGNFAYTFENWFPGLNVYEVTTINNRGQVMLRVSP